MFHTMDRRWFLKTAGGITAAAAVGGARCPLRAAESAQQASPAEKLGWQLGCCAYSFSSLTFYETIDKVASLKLKTLVGFNWQKLSPRKATAVFGEKMSVADRKEARRRLADAGVRLVCCYCNGLTTKDSCRRLFAFAQEMGIETIDGEPPPAAFDMLERLCEEYRLNLAVHNHAKPSSYWQPETLLGVLRGRSKRIGACCDTGHWTRSGLDPVAALRKLQGRILTFDLKDVDENGVCVPFGRGKSDIRGILKELHRQHFRGVFGIEYDQHPADIEEQLSQCIAYFNKTTKELAPA